MLGHRLRPRRRLRPLLAALVLIGPYAAIGQSSAPAEPPPPPACTHCKEKLGTLDALHNALPAQWQLERERDPVFGGEVLVVQAGRAHAQSLVLVHGLGQNGFTDFLPLIEGLAARYHVIALDLPGYGYSSSPEGKYSPTNYARVLRWLLERHAKGPALVVGHSMGGAVALRFASEHPALVKKLVVADAAGILHRTAFVKHRVSVPIAVDGLPDFLKNQAARVKDWGNAVVEKIFSLPGDPTAALRRSDIGWSMALRDRSNINAGLALVDEDYTQAIHALQVPVQIIWGEADTIAPLRTGYVLAERLPRAQLHTLSGVGHVPSEHEVERFAALLDKVLDADPVPASRRAMPVKPSTRDAHCKGLVDRQYSGHYREIRIEGCNAVRLVDLSAERIVIRDSIVQMLRTRVESDGVAVDIGNSELIATASELRGSIAIRSDGSRLDLAGVSLVAGKHAVEVQNWSRVIASVSSVQSPAYDGWWHESRDIERGSLVPAASAR